MIDDARFEALRDRLGELHGRSHALARQLGDVDLSDLRGPADLALIPVLRKSALAAHAGAPSRRSAASRRRRTSAFARLFASPGGIYEPGVRRPRRLGRGQGLRRRGRRAGRDRGQLLLLPPDARRADSRERRAGARLPGHSGRSRQYRAAHRRDRASEAERLLRPAGFPQDRARQGARGGGRRLLDPQGARLRRGAAAELCAPSSKAPGSRPGRPTPPPISASSPTRPTTPNGDLMPGMLVNDELIVEIVTPGTNDPAPAGKVGEVVVTRLSGDYPLLRFATGDLSAWAAPGRLKGWMGRADQSAKVKGLFVHPGQIVEIGKRHPRTRRAAARRAARGRAGRDDAFRRDREPERSAREAPSPRRCRR